MSGLKERLERLRAAAKATERETDGGAADGNGMNGANAAAGTDERLHRKFRELGVTEATNEAGAFLLRVRIYPFPYKYGRYGLEDLAACSPRLLPVASRQNGGGSGSRKKAIPATELPPPEAGGLLFLDTETTGLGVGAGNVPFMVGIGRCTDTAFVVEQGLIRHPGEERAMLTWLMDRFRGVTHLATYNGRTFDWPVLVNRFILNGWRRSGQEPGHLDFLHPARALWKNTLPTCRLGTVEEERLGIARGEDVPGALAPELYLRFLRDGDPDHLGGVYIHNEKDILTLASLAVHFGHLLGGGLGTAVPAPTDAEERFRTGAWLEQHGRAEEAQRMYELLAAEQAAFAGSETGWRLALAAKYKRLGQWERALPMWEQAAALAEAAVLPRLDAHLELAIHYEHRAKDFEKAMRYAEAALALVYRRSRAARVTASSAVKEERARLERRIDRLRRKRARSMMVPASGFDEAEDSVHESIY